ncbi:MAG: hypothetical protein NZ898_15630 [Myxococcota bacterium]|nr:hypothetical protein [Myxococcota bacterium]MDW8361802.1 hypothetical protein [Myxococcales bacterium]
MGTDSTANAANDEARRFPPGIPYIVGNEGAERFSYYGMRAILKTYLASLYLKMTLTAEPGLTGEALEAAQKAASSKATAVTHLFMAGVYAFPMIGALLADRLLGKFPVIFWLSLVYCAGHGTLAVAGAFDSIGDGSSDPLSWYGLTEWGFYVGLALIAIGSGGIKPCVSANVGDQFTAKNAGLVSIVFQIFYFIINFGSFFATIVIPILKDSVGPHLAFGVPGIAMGIATLVFWLGRKRFLRVPPRPGGTLGLLDVLSSTCFFSPIVATIIAVFVVSDGYQPPPRALLEQHGAAAFYGEYLRTYLGYLAVHSWHWFAASAVLLVVGWLLFLARQKRAQDTGFLAMLVYALAHRRERRPGERLFDVVRARFGDEVAEGPPAVLRIVLVFSMVSVFWALFDQHASTWITQASRMDLVIRVPQTSFSYWIWGTVALSIYGGIWLFLWVSNVRVPARVTWAAIGLFVAGAVAAAIADAVQGVRVEHRLRPEQISALNPLMVMMIIPALNAGLFRPLERRGIVVRPLQKMTAGMFLAAVAFAAAAILQSRIEALHASGEKVHVLWQVVQYLVMTTAEVLVSVTGLEFAYTQAPRAMKSTIMGFWLLCVMAGNILVAFLAPMETILELSEFFWVFTALMAGAAVLFAVMAYFYKGKTYLQAESPG